MRRATFLAIVARALAAGALCVVAVAVVTGLAEIATRLIDGVSLTTLQLPPTYSYGRPTPERSLIDLARTLPHADDVDPTWIDASPPPLENRKPPDPQLLAARVADGGRTRLEGNLYRQWNARWAAQLGCGPQGSLPSLPLPLLVFDPPEPDVQPIYRFPLGVTTPLGLVLNRFGWRGPEIPLDKPAATIRVAFVGASTTVGLHHYPFSYPEYVVHWLNLWAERTGSSVRFDGVNAGREGIISTSIAAIVRQELLPAEPDLVVYYEGANQFRSSSLIDIPVPPSTGPLTPATGLWQWLAAPVRPYSALFRRLDKLRAIAATHGGAELSKPPYRLTWPARVDELNPDITSREMPLQLPTILDDLEAIRTALAGIGSELAVGSFVWLVADGMQLDPRRHFIIHAVLNRQWWPFRYADMRRMADFQNRVLARYAAAHDLLFLDLATVVPQDPDLFLDAIHFTREGTRVQAWSVLNAILPRVRERLAAGVWPRPDRVPIHRHPGIQPPARLVDGCAGLARHMASQQQAISMPPRRGFGQ